MIEIFPMIELLYGISITIIGIFCIATLIYLGFLGEKLEKIRRKWSSQE